MADILRVVEKNDLATVRLDLNAIEGGAASGFGLIGPIVLLPIETRAAWLEQQGVPGALQAAADHPIAELRVRLRAAHTSYDSLAALARSLATELDREGVLEWRPEGSGASRYLHYFRSPIPALFHGQDLPLLRIARQFRDTEGIEVVFWCEPYLRRAESGGSPTSLTNGPLARELIVTNPGNAPALARVTVAPTQAAARLAAVRVGLRSQGILNDFAAVYGFEVEGATLGTDTTAVPDAEASPGGAGNTCAETTFATAALARRWRKVLTAASAGALKGRFRAVVALRATAAGRYRVQLRHATVDSDPAEVAAEEVELDFTDVASFKFVEVDLGTADGRGATLVLEGWAARDSGAGNLRWDLCYLLPADELVTLAAVPGLRGGGTDTTVYRGRELATIAGFPTVVNENVRLDAVNDEVGLPGGLRALKTGRQVVTAVVRLRNKLGTRQKLGELYVVDDLGATVATVDLSTSKRRWSRREKTVRFDAVGGRTYDFRVKLTNSPGGSEARIVVMRLRHSFQRYATSGDTLVLDAIARDAALHVGGSRIAPLTLTGGYVELPPGDSALVLSALDLPPSAYDDVDAREQLAAHVFDRAFNVTVDLVARDTPL